MDTVEDDPRYTKQLLRNSMVAGLKRRGNASVTRLDNLTMHTGGGHADVATLALLRLITCQDRPLEARTQQARIQRQPPTTQHNQETAFTDTAPHGPNRPPFWKSTGTATPSASALHLPGYPVTHDITAVKQTHTLLVKVEVGISSPTVGHYNLSTD